jgi:dihydroorotase
MASEASAAQAGGVHTVCEMPNTNPPTTSVEAFKDKVHRAEKISDVDIRFFFGATELEHLNAFKQVWGSPQCCGLKIFFDHSTGDQGANKQVIDEAFKLCAELDAPLVAHCEDALINAEAKKQILEDAQGDESDVGLHSLMRPCAAEVAAITQALEYAEHYGTRLHVAHLSTAEGLRKICQAKKKKIAVTCQVTPHHLFLSTQDYARLGSLGKMNPPLRTPSECAALWEGIADGTVDCIATDHAPHTLAEKNANPPLSAPSGVPGVETMLPLLLTVAAGGWPHPAGESYAVDFSYEKITELCCINPNRIFRLQKNSGPLLTIDPDAEWVIHGKDLHSLCGWTPYEGWIVRGKIVS